MKLTGGFHCLEYLQERPHIIFNSFMEWLENGLYYNNMCIFGFANHAHVHIYNRLFVYIVRLSFQAKEVVILG